MICYKRLQSNRLHNFLTFLPLVSVSVCVRLYDSTVLLFSIELKGFENDSVNLAFAQENKKSYSRLVS